MPYRKKHPQDSVEELQAKKEALRAQFDERIQKVNAELKAQQARLRREQEKRRTHLNIIVGAAVQAHAEIDPQWKAQLDNVLNKAVRRADQREALGLPPLPDKTDN